ncbi:hypothetical protein BC831DRAFT_441525, partial [Entophlyctis helioformis]
MIVQLAMARRVASIEARPKPNHAASYWRPTGSCLEWNKMLHSDEDAKVDEQDASMEWKILTARLRRRSITTAD